jgi:hypothetical protein
LTDRNQHRKFFGIALTFLSLLGPVFVRAAEIPDTSDSSGPKTNLVVFQNLTGTIFHGLIPRLGLRPGDTLNFSPDPSYLNWFVISPAIAEFVQTGCIVFRDGGTARRGIFDVRVGTPDPSVKYEQCSGGGFSEKEYRRTLKIGLLVRVEKLQTGEIVFDNRLEASQADTVRASDVPNLERDEIGLRHTTLPGGNWLDTIVEPFVIIGATGLAVYLLFHVRS